jgi:hypothetical protein
MLNHVSSLRRAWRPDGWPIAALALVSVVCAAGCGDVGGKRRNASGSVAGTGMVGADPNALASSPQQPAGTPPVVQPQAGNPPSTGQAPAYPQNAAPPAGQPGTGPAGQPAPQGGALPGLPGVNLPGQPQPNTITEKAQPGASGKGNYGGPGAVTTPISVYFQAQERLIYDSVTYAVKLFEAEHGYKPKTEEEFMKKVIEANQIRLPQLPPGSKYKYDPQTGELMVEHPQ